MRKVVLVQTMHIKKTIFEIVDGLLQENRFQTKKEDGLNNDVSLIYMQKLSLSLIVVAMINLSCFCQERLALG